jgi:hypothetical protein
MNNDGIQPKRYLSNAGVDVERYGPAANFDFERVDAVLLAIHESLIHHLLCGGKPDHVRYPNRRGETAQELVNGLPYRLTDDVPESNIHSAFGSEVTYGARHPRANNENTFFDGRGHQGTTD